MDVTKSKPTQPNEIPSVVWRTGNWLAGTQGVETGRRLTGLVALVCWLICCCASAAVESPQPHWEQELEGQLRAWVWHENQAAETAARERLEQLSEEHGNSFFLCALKTAGSMGLLDDSMWLSNLLKSHAPRNKEVLMPLLTSGQPLPNLIIAELLVDMGLNAQERDEVASYILDVFTDEQTFPRNPAFARAAVVLARLKPSSQLAAPRLVELLLRKEHRGIRHYANRLLPSIFPPTGNTDYPRAHVYAAYVLSKLGPYGPEWTPYVPKLLKVLRRLPSVEKPHLSFLPANHGLNLRGLEELEVLVDPDGRRETLLAELRRTALTFAEPDVPAPDVEDAVWQAESLLMADYDFYCEALISDVLVGIGPFAVPELLNALNDPQLNYLSAGMLLRIKPMQPELLAEMLQWLDGDDVQLVCYAVLGLRGMGNVVPQEAVEKGMAKLAAMLRSIGCMTCVRGLDFDVLGLGYPFAVSVEPWGYLIYVPELDFAGAEAASKFGKAEFACAYAAASIRECQTDPSRIIAAPFRLLVRLGRPAIPTIEQFAHDKDWRTRFMAHLARRSIEERQRAPHGVGSNRSARGEVRY